MNAFNYKKSALSLGVSYLFISLSPPPGVPGHTMMHKSFQAPLITMRNSL